MTIYDAKNSLFLVLKNALDSLYILYPDKISVKVTTAYPRTVTEIDTKALVTIARVTNQEETKFVTDLVSEEITANENAKITSGAFQTDLFEIAIWTLDAQYRDDLYLLIRQLLFENKRVLMSDPHNFIKFYRVGGADQEIDVAKLPRTIYRAVLNYLVMTKMIRQSTDDLVQGITVSTIISSGSLI
jgi:hypothetical protein